MPLAFEVLTVILPALRIASTIAGFTSAIMILSKLPLLAPATKIPVWMGPQPIPKKIFSLIFKTPAGLLCKAPC